MRPRALSLVAMMCVAPAAAWAQVGFRSAVVLEHRLAALTSPARADLFRARPETYHPRPDNRSIYDIPFVPWGPWYAEAPAPEWPLDRDRQGAAYERCAGVVRGCPVPPKANDAHGVPLTDHPRAPATNEPSVAAPAVPGPPKTFFLIAGCYAGDRPPRQEWLAPGCDLSNLRAVGP